MGRSKATPTELAYYEGLVRKTASMYERIVEEEFDDLCQILRLKAWRALGTYDPTRSKLPVERYVFSCLRNQVKDLLKKKRRNELFIEDIVPATPNAEAGDRGVLRDRFEAHYLIVREDQAYAGVATDTPLIPSTLTQGEREVMALLYLDYGQTEIALRLRMTKREVTAAVKALREKMADWNPGTSPNGRQHLTVAPPAGSEAPGRRLAA
jgi:RNA polymerase sigma factor (sigma-70 family)